MGVIVKRLFLGFSLIALTSGVLLVSDWGRRNGGRGRKPRVAVLQHASQPVLDEGVQGMLDALADHGFVGGQTLVIRRFNAENDLPTANAIARQITNGEFDMVLTASTLSMQTVANANKSGKVIHVFGIVADPFGAGVGISRDHPLEHPKHLVGIGTFLPVAKAFGLAKTLYPGLKSVGVAWNAAESNSEAFTRSARQACRELGIGLLEANIDSSSAVFEAVNSLVGRGAEALWVGGDVTVLVALDSVVAAAKKGHIPVFSIIPPSVKRGTLFDLGANFYEVGQQTGALAAQILQGADPAKIPVTNFVPEKLAVNRLALTGLKDPWHFPGDLLARADVAIDENGIHEKAAPTASRPLLKKWKVHLIELNNIVDVEETEQGVMEGLGQANLAAGRDYEITISNAQGDMATVNGLVDSALSQGADLLITLSTPTLQAALQRAQRVPIVFTYVANGILAGAGRSDEDHLPNVTGISIVGAFGDMISLLRQCLPSARRIGTLFVPAEVNMVFNKDQLVEAAGKSGIEVVPVAVSTSSEISDAALALMSRNIDALCQIPGNLTAGAFGGIAQAARKAKLPVFAFQKVQAREGAAITLARDYHDAGRGAAFLAARIMRGEKPASIPLQSLSKTKLIINLEAARASGLSVPPSLLSKADEVIGR
jgi:ABC-type uncharacterized transport system substrate-binding protein